MRHPAFELACLGLAVAATGIGCAGLVRMRGAMARLHHGAWVTLVAPVLIAAALAAEHGWTADSLKAAVVAIVLAGTAPLLAHVAARGIHFHEHERGAEDKRM